MDISIAITRTSIFVLVYTIVLGIPFAIAHWFRYPLIGIFNINWWMVPLVLMAVLATLGPYVYIFLNRKAEDRLLKRQKRYQDVLKHAAIGMTRIRDLRKLLDLIAHIITKTVKISFAAIYLLDTENKVYIQKAHRGTHREITRQLACDNTLITWLTITKKPLVYGDVKLKLHESFESMSFQSLEKEMRELKAAVIIPSFLEDTLMGILVLGNKLSGHIYTMEDLNVFQVLTSQAALAIENAQFYEEAQSLQEQIAQAEKMATIGTMADGLSHQINNRFYALSLIAGDSLDTIKMTDTSNCSPEIKEVFNQVVHGLERIQANVIQGGAVVRGILTYTRKGDTGLEPLTLQQVIEGTLAMVQFKIKLSEIDVVLDFPDDTPKLKGNLVQLQEVFFNFIDNAYDSMNERKQTLKEEGYRGKIIFRATPLEGFLKIEIKDNGMGIKSENIKKIFTPFFTTKVSSRKGTGLGLYVINKIITDTHKGTIAFESHHGQGTLFTVRIPLSI